MILIYLGNVVGCIKPSHAGLTCVQMERRFPCLEHIVYQSTLHTGGRAIKKTCPQRLNDAMRILERPGGRSASEMIVVAGVNTFQTV